MGDFEKATFLNKKIFWTIHTMYYIMQLQEEINNIL